MRQIALFLLAGGTAAAVNVGSRIVYSQFAPLALAVTLAYLTGMLVAFYLNRWFVFADATDQMGTRAGRFIVVNALAVLQTLVVTLLGTRALHALGVGDVAETAAHTVGVVVPVLSSYVMHKRWTFANKSTAEDLGS